MRPPADPLSCEIGQLPELWLCVSCPQGKSVDYPLRLLAKRYHPWVTLRSVIPRLRCRCCMKRPSAIVLAETPYTSGQGMRGADPGWKIALGPATADGSGKKNSSDTHFFQDG